MFYSGSSKIKFNSWYFEICWLFSWQAIWKLCGKNTNQFASCFFLFRHLFIYLFIFIFFLFIYLFTFISFLFLFSFLFWDRVCKKKSRKTYIDKANMEWISGLSRLVLVITRKFAFLSFLFFFIFPLSSSALSFYLFLNMTQLSKVQKTTRPVNPLESFFNCGPWWYCYFELGRRQGF